MNSFLYSSCNWFCAMLGRPFSKSSFIMRTDTLFPP